MPFAFLTALTVLAFCSPDLAASFILCHSGISMTTPTGLPQGYCNKILNCENKILGLIHAIDALQPAQITRANRHLFGTLNLNAQTLRGKLAGLLATLQPEFSPPQVQSSEPEYPHHQW
jgi:hypothetical protein